jgi:phosphatidylglycerophosphate synthase
MHSRSFYIVNGITLYRLIAAPVLLYLVLNRHLVIFPWLLGFSFFTDVLDGFLARHYRVNSVIGARLDSIADDLTIVVAIVGLFYLRPGFFDEQYPVIISLVVLYLTQVTMALVRYRSISTFHTYMAKTATLFQGTFLILFFFTLSPILPLFYIAVLITALQLVEEIMLVMILPRKETDVKGLYWVLKKERYKSRDQRLKAQQDNMKT